MPRHLPSLKKNALLNSLRTVMTIIFPLVTYPYVTRTIQAENLGKVNFASSSIQYFSLISVLGIATYASREGIRYRDQKDDLNQFCSEVFTLNLITTVFSFFLLFISFVFVAKFREYFCLILIYSMTIIFSTIGVSWLFSIEEDYKYITIKSITIQAISLVLLFIIIRKPEDYIKYALLNVFANVGSNIYNIFYCRKYIDLHICKDLKKVFSHLKSCLIFFSSSIASSIYSNIDITMLGFYSNDYVIGIYSAAVKIYVMIKTILTAIISVMIPRLTYYISHDKPDEYNKLLSHLIKLMWTFLLPIVAGVILTSKEIVMVVLGEGYEDSRLALIILSVAIFFSIFASVSNGCILIVNKKEKMALLTTVSAAIVNVVLNFIAIPLWEANGAAITTVVSEAVILAISWPLSKKYIKLENMTRTVMSSIFGCIIMAIVGIYIDMQIGCGIYSLSLKIIFCASIYFVLLYFLKNEIVTFYTRTLVNILRKFS